MKAIVYTEYGSPDVLLKEVKKTLLKDDFTQNRQQYDLIFDAVGNRSVSDFERALNPHGK